MATRLKNFNFEELVAAEKAATSARRTYEDKMVMYRGIDYNNLTEREKTELEESSQKLGMLNAVRLKIINEMEKRLLNLDCDD